MRVYESPFWTIGMNTEMRYVEIFAAAVPTANRDEYIKFLKVSETLLKENGALAVVDCWGVNVPEGETTSFLKAVKCEPGETVCVGWIIWPSEKIRNEGMVKVAGDPRLQAVASPLPFEGKRMIVGGFEPLLGA